MRTYIMQYVVRHIGWLACLSVLVLPEAGLAACASNEIEEPPIGAMAAPVCVPRDDFTLIGSMSFTPNTLASNSGITIEQEMYQGDRWITANQENVGTLGLTSQQVSNAMRRFPRNASYVFAQYSQENSTGRITVQKVEKTPNGVLQVHQADFTPWSGRLWKAQGKYRSASEISAQSAGNNPFALFEGSLGVGDPVFYNMNWDAFVVAVGHAMRRYGASVGYISVDAMNQNSVSQCQSKAFGFKKSCTTTLTVYANPVWYLATPMEASLAGQQAAYCVVNTGGGCDDPAHVAYSGIVVTSMNGGNMPVTPGLGQPVTSFSSTKTTWAIGIGLLDFLFTPALGPGMHTGSSSSAGGLSTGIMIVNPLAPIAGTADGVQPAQPWAVGFGRTVESDIEAMHVQGMSGAKLTGDSQLYSNTAWQPGSYVEYNATAAMRQRYNDCVQQGLSGVAARQCAAPQTQPIVP